MHAKGTGSAPAAPSNNPAEKILKPTILGRRSFLALLQKHGWVGILLIAICWPLNWALPGMRTAYLFFPLWLGYILVVDALVWVRRGTSLWNRSRWHFVLLFVASAPV